MSELHLPEELLHDILQLVLQQPENIFCQFPKNSTPRWKSIYRPRSFTPSSDALLVSKQWLRIGSPILYRNICLWKPKHTTTVAAVLKAHPTLRTAVRCLRVEGGMGADFPDVAVLATNVRTVYFCANIPPSESCSGLYKALSVLNPSQLYIYFHQLHGGVRTLEVILPQLEFVIRHHWKRLSTITIGNGCDMSRQFLHSLSEAPSLTSISLSSLWDISSLEPLVGSPKLRELRYYGTFDKELMKHLLGELDETGKFASLFRFHKPEEFHW